MNWDIMLIKTKGNLEPMNEIEELHIIDFNSFSRDATYDASYFRQAQYLVGGKRWIKISC